MSGNGTNQEASADPPMYSSEADQINDIARIGSFVSNASAVILEMVAIFRNEKTKPSEWKSACDVMESLATKLRDTDSALVSAAAKSNRRIPAVSRAVVKLRNEEKRKQAANPQPVSKRHKKSEAVKKVEAFEVVRTLDVGVATGDIMGADSSPTVPIRRTSPRVSIIPAPPNGKEYSPREVIAALRCLPDEKIRTAAKQLLLKERDDGDGKKYSWVPIQKRQLNGFWSQWKDSISPPPP
jgi:hypothetical protein